LEDILRNGFLTWRKNLNIAVPFLLSSIINLLLIVIFITIIYFFLNPFQSSFATASYGRYSPLSSINWLLLLLDILLVISFLIIMSIISSFFYAGAIGMSKKAIETGKTTLDDMIEYGKKKFITIFLINLLIFIFVLIICLILAIIQMIFRGEFITIFVTIVDIVFAVVPFAVVIGDLGVIEGLKKGFRFFIDNKFPVVLLWIFVRYITQFIGYIPIFIAAIIFSIGILFVPIPSDISSIPSFTSPNLLIPLLLVFLLTIAVSILVSWIISVFVISPLTTIWWSKLYLDGKK